MKTPTLLLGALLCAVILIATARADRPALPRIGVLAGTTPYEQGLRTGLLDLGYVEGKNITVDWRHTAGGIDEVRSHAIEMSNSKIDLIVVFGTSETRTVMEVSTAPIVFLSGDPIGTGLVTTLARPGGNATGVSSTGPELTAKRLELLRQFAPHAHRIGCLVNTSNPAGALQLKQAETAASDLGVDLIKFDARNDAEVDAAVHAIPRSALDGLLVTGDNLLFSHRAKIGRAVHKAKLPAMYPIKEYRGEGVLLSYGPSLKEAGRMTAVYVDKILKGAKPGDIPVEQLSRVELVINLQVAREEGIKVPEELLYRANEVIR
ncbi:MAG: hypothetical protein C5B46_03350 [Proteobacteria bacterium]|nr:MAG: hypothetical protein C5B46_03350 [Pseudomonadota bacterium]